VLLKIKALNTDVLIGTGYLDDAILAVRQSKDQRVDFKAMVFTTGPELEDFTKNLGKDADYAYGVAWWMPEANFKCPVFGTTQAYVGIYSKKFVPGSPIRPLQQAREAFSCNSPLKRQNPGNGQSQGGPELL